MTIRTAEHSLAMCAETPELLPLVLPPGMGADQRLFAAQAAALPGLVTSGPNAIGP